MSEKKEESKKEPKGNGEWVKECVEKADPKIARLEEENARLSKLLGLVQTYHAAAGEAPKWMPYSGKFRKGSAIACLQFSDLHLDEVVDPGEIGGLNAYSREIAELRLKRWANKACEMGDRYRHKWDGAVIFCDGDLVSGSIHEELVATNADYLPGSMVFWAPRIASAFRQVADFYGKVHVPCVVGNHGRLTIKKQAKGRGKNSWDWLLCQMVRSHLANDERITFDIANGSYLFVPLYQTFAFETHGDETGGGSGWSGIWTPLMTIHRRGMELGLAHGIKPSFSVIGHWHSTTLAHHRGISANGAMKGFDEYASTLRLKPEPAMQNWFVMTPENGVTLAGPLLLEDRKKEGW